MNNLCHVLRGKVVIPPTGLNDLEDSNLKIYPNPFKNEFTIEFGKDTDINAQIQLIDASGKVIESKTPNISISKISFDLSNQPKGIYYVTLRENGKTFTSKVLSL